MSAKFNNLPSNLPKAELAVQFILDTGLVGWQTRYK